MQRGIILKYITKAASSVEIKQMEDWIATSDDNAKKFRIIKAEYVAATFDQTINTVNIDAEYAKYHYQIAPQGRKKRSKHLRFLMVSAVAVIAGIGYFYVQEILNPPIKTSEKSIILQLSDDSTKVIYENKNSSIKDIHGNIIKQQQKNILVYNASKEDNPSVTKTLIYNTLSVPYAKRFTLVLSDGTRVLLNSGSSIRYPVEFIPQEKKRQVYLTGEAFFEVTKDDKHPFVVHMKEQQIEVLGTSFNVSAYPEDQATNTVLVEGLVKLTTKETAKETYLKPGQKAEWNTQSFHIDVEEADTDIYTAWTIGRVVFRHMSFANISKKLERHYGIRITNYNASLDRKYFTASFDVESIEEVMETFSLNHNISYTIIDNQVIVH